MNNRSIKKEIIKFIAVVAIALLIELLVFNFSQVSMLLNSHLSKNACYSLKDMKQVNWENYNDRIISDPDPMLILSGINNEVRVAEIRLEADEPLKSMTVFYTNSQDELFSDKGMIKANAQQGVFLVSLNKFVKDLRIDVTENAGLVLHNMTIIINPVKLNISFSRIITVVLIYLSTILLFKLQKSPDYHMYSKKEDN